MSLEVRRFGNPEGIPIVLLPGFGDNGSLFEPLAETGLGEHHALLAVDLPGTGTARHTGTPVTLKHCALLVRDLCRAEGVRIVIAHSVASIIASLAATQPRSRIEIIVSLEGNLTAEDAYFSGSAAGYADPYAFHNAFLARLDSLAETSFLARYRSVVAQADPVALWELGCDAHRFSEGNVPGDLLAAAAERVLYLYNPANCTDESLAWLAEAVMTRVAMENASHWKSVQNPARLGREIARFLEAETH